MEGREKQYAALAPLMAFAGVFIHPVASTVLPLFLFFLFRWWSKPDAGLLALRTADLSFTIQLSIFIASLLLILYSYVMPVTELWAQRILALATILFLGYFLVSLAVAMVQGVRGRVVRYWFSFRIAERIFNTVKKEKH